jgi:hypothetical protein
VDSSLTELFKMEQERVFEPGADFTQRVVWRLSQQSGQQQMQWETMMVVTRKMLPVVVTCLLALIGIQLLTPVKPNRGLTQIYVESEVSPVEEHLYLDTQPPPASVVFDELISGNAQ